MPSNEGRYIDIRSSGGNVVGRVHEMIDGKKVVTRIKHRTRKDLLRAIRRKYNVNPSLQFQRRGMTYF